MREIIGENLKTFLDNMCVGAAKTYSGNIGYWSHFEVWEMSEEDYEKICGLTDEEYEKLAAEDSWWRGANGSNQGIPNTEFVVNNHPILAWRDMYYLQVEWDELPSDEKSEYKDFDDYCDVWFPKKYKNILEYFCEELGASTERNVCALATDLAKYNNITIAELFRKYGGSNGNN